MKKTSRIYVSLDSDTTKMLDVLCTLNNSDRAQVIRNMISKSYSDYLTFLQKKDKRQIEAFGPNTE
ncbi:MAG: hypothetical protein HQK89_09640 [Nitrospirae bacterium]|nr:hypothetical protein [Nitrospirota bacterium]